MVDNPAWHIGPTNKIADSNNSKVEMLKEDIISSFSQDT